MILVEPRAVTRWYHEWIAVLVALLLTVATTSALLASLGLDPISSLHRIFINPCLLYTSPSPRDMRRSRMPSSA